MPISGSYYYFVNNGSGQKNTSRNKLWDGTTTLEFDKAGFIPVLDAQHAFVHKGNVNVISDYDADVDIADIKHYLLQTPATPPYIHLVINVEASAELKVELYESGSYPASGSQLTVINNNRVSGSDDTSFLVWSSCSFDGTNTGSLLVSSLLGSGRGAFRLGDERRSEEYVLAPGTDYLLKINAITDDTRTNVNFIYYKSNVAS